MKTSNVFLAEATSQDVTVQQIQVQSMPFRWKRVLFNDLMNTEHSMQSEYMAMSLLNILEARLIFHISDVYLLHFSTSLGCAIAVESDRMLFSASS